ncbi:uncharacterized protein [Medicago truncatula]|uniref:uncharacterized protein n=1 Tax=Medicago truncatula TaxID=3880 RepID=UPI000D2F1720|nr:uncharacterized protein LOC112418683 [Medicago truncatula]
MMCLSQETWSPTRLNFHIQNYADTIKASFQSNGDSTPDRFGGVIRNSAGLYLSGFSGFIADSTDILLAELSAIHRGLLMAADMELEDLVCYSDSLLSINLITGQASIYHSYAVLIQDIRDLLVTHNFTVHHCLREGNQCADFMAKLGASSNE